jgi:hypothetical protein
MSSETLLKSPDIIFKVPSGISELLISSANLRARIEEVSEKEITEHPTVNGGSIPLSKVYKELLIFV